MEIHLEKLNPRQREAVLHKKGPLLIIAGAGAGKTKTIVHRIHALIRSGVAGREILAVTFTNKAAGEMRDRVRQLIRSDKALARPVEERTPDPELPFVSTFHALGVSILRNEHRAAGLHKTFIIYDREDSLRAIKKAVERVELDPKQFDPRKILGRISRAKGDNIDQEQFETGAHDFFARRTASIWRAYENILKEARALDFDDLLIKTVRLLEANREMRRRYQHRWPYIHIDEYQDTNRVQYELSRLLVGPEQNICVVGDSDQSIYSWRGADFTNILNFEKDYPGARIVLLEENYRSTKTILDAANSVIQKNAKRKEKNLFTKKGAGEKISLYAAEDENDEARFVADRAAALIEAGVPPERIAVLYRANFQSRVLEEAFLARTIPYHVVGVRFFERKEVKDMLAYLRAALREDDTEARSRAANIPPRGIGKVTLAKWLSGKVEELAPVQQKRVRDFEDLLGRIRACAAETTPSRLIKYVLRASGLEEHLKRGGSDDIERLENIEELVTLATHYDDLPAEEALVQFLSDAALMAYDEAERKEQKGVRLMTAHASKGLEFAHVFVTGLEEDLFPHARAGEESDDEEERRLFYVALTRAEEKLYLSYAGRRTLFGRESINMPSSFLFEVDEAHIESAHAPSEHTITID